jgi:hypothetical protein
MQGFSGSRVTGRDPHDVARQFAFNTTDRLANAFAFEVLSHEGFEASAKYLLRRGYQ